MFAIDFPPVSHVVEWPAIWGHGMFAVNKVVLLMWLAVVLVLAFLFAGGKRSLVPTGVQNLAEMAVEFVQDGIIMQTMGPEGLYYTPYLLTLFLFIFVCNV